MRASEFIVEDSTASDRFADGELKFTQHVNRRSEQRGIPMTDIVKALKRLETQRGKELRQLPPTGFVVKTPYGFEMAIVKRRDLDTKKVEYVVTTVRERLKLGAGQRVIYLENAQTDQPLRMAKIERTGQIVQILRHEDQVKFSDDTGWFLVNTEPGKRTGTGVKWIPDSTRFAWVKNFKSLKESSARIPRAIEEFLDSLNPDDCGVDEIGAYRIHYEGFTSDCKSSKDYRRDPEAVYQQVYKDFIQREGGVQPLVQDMVGDENFPILFSIFRKRQPIQEAQQATAQQVLSYINKTHHEPMTDKLARAVMAHPQWELVKVPLLNLNIPDQEYDDVEQEPEADPYGRVMAVEPEHAGEVSTHLVDRKPIVIDSDRYIIDGNHRAWAAKYLLNRDYIQAWRPVTQVNEDANQYLYHATYQPLLKSIQAKGLGNTTQSQWTDSKPGVVYLARDPEVARSYAETAESVPEAWLDQIVVLQISQKDLDADRLGTDQNVQDNTGDTLEYRGVISANKLKRIR